METSKISVSGNSSLSNDIVSQPQAHGESMRNADDLDLDDLTLIQAIKRARVERIKKKGLRIPRRPLTSVLAATDCEPWKLRKKPETPAPVPTTNSPHTLALSNGVTDSSQQPASSVPSSSRPSSNANQRSASNIPSKLAPSTLTPGIGKEGTDSYSQRPGNRHLPDNDRPSASGGTPESNTAHVPARKPKASNDKASLEKKRPRPPSPNASNSTRSNGERKRPRTTVSSSSEILQASKAKPPLKPGPGALQAIRAHDKEEDIPPTSKTRIQTSGLSQADIELFNNFKAKHPTTQPAELVPWQTINSKAVQKAAVNAPSRQEHSQTKIRAKARASRREQIENRIVQNQRQEYPNKSPESIRKDAAARVDAWERDRQAADKREKQFEKNVSTVRRQLAVTNLSVKPSEFLSPARLLTVYSVFRCDPFHGELEAQELEDKVFRDGTYTTLEKANKAASDLLIGGSAAVLAQREINSRIVQEEGGVLQGSAKQSDGKKFFCFVKKEYQQVGELPAEITQGKKVREDALKIYKKGFEVISMCTRLASAQPTIAPDEEDGHQRELFLSSQSPQQERETSVASVATATFPEGSGNPAEYLIPDLRKHGTYVDRAWANREAFKVMRRLWKPRGARMDAVLQYRDKIEPWLDNGEQQDIWDTHNVEFTFNPPPHDKTYNFISSKV